MTDKIKDYDCTGFILLKFKFLKRISDMDKAKEDLNQQFSDLAINLVEEYAVSGCVDWGIEIEFREYNKVAVPKTFIGYRYYCPEAHFLFSRNLTDRITSGNHTCGECDAAYSYDLLTEVKYDT